MHEDENRDAEKSQQQEVESSVAPRPPEGGVQVAEVASLAISQRRWTQFAFIALAFLVFWIVPHIIRGLWGVFAEPEEAPAEIIGALVAAVVAWVAYSRGRYRRFVDESVSELGQVTWPTRAETYRSGYIVIVVSLIAAVVLFAMDAFWAALTDFIYKI